MLISHKYGFVFIKTRKTAGTSVEIALSRHMGPDDVITRFGPDEDEALRIQYHGRPAQNEAIPKTRWRRPTHWLAAARGRSIRYHHHTAAESVRRFVGRSRWDRYFTFTVDRNPWDLAVSAYHWHYHFYRNDEPQSFDGFVLSPALKIYSNWRMYTIGGKVAVDRMLRYDRLEKDLAEVTDQLGVPRLNLPRAKATQRKDRKPYREWYIEETKDRVTEVFRQEIDYFGWTFD